MLDMVSRDTRPQRVISGFPISEGYRVRSTEDAFQEDGLPFRLDDDSSVPVGSPSFAGRLPQRLSYVFSCDAKAERKEVTSSTPRKTDSIDSSHRQSEKNLKESIDLKDHRQAANRSKGFILQHYSQFPFALKFEEIYVLLGSTVSLANTNFLIMVFTPFNSGGFI